MAHYTITARNDKYKYIYYTRDVETAGLEYVCKEFIPRFVGNENFYDLDIDPYEKNNLIGNSIYG